MKKWFVFLAVLGLVACGDTDAPEVTATPAPASTPIPVKVVIITMFEIGEDTGDTAGEFQLWNERRELTEVFEFQGHHDLHFNRDSGIMAMVTGIGTAKATASVMALGMDPRFDFRETYWMVAGIAGFDPEDASIGSAAWAEHVIDGDLAHEIDAREMPEDWPYGYFARYTKKPFDPAKPEPTGEMFTLNKGLTDWAYTLTKDIELPDFPDLEATRSLYTEHENARKKPFVMKGDNLAAMTFWHGEILNNWANEWVDYWTNGEGEFVSSAMEDTGTYQSLLWLTKAGKADVDRLMVLRTASNYTMPPPGVSAADNLLAENEHYSGLVASLESAYVVGSEVIDTLLADWEHYAKHVPGKSGSEAP